jgi:fused signal recognition particle receptor
MDYMLMSLGLVIVIIGFIYYFKSSKKTSSKISTQAEVVTQAHDIQVKSWKERLLNGLERSRQEIWSKIFNANLNDAKEHEQVEELLYAADLPTNVITDLLENLKGINNDPKEIQQKLYSSLLKKLTLKNSTLSLDQRRTSGPKVIMIVGVNGVGKTTTIGKLATKLKSQGARVLVGACDTFRAAAVDQLKVWCERAGVDMLRAKNESDPSGVAYDTVNKAYNENYDFCLIDTAGRLHTAVNLMDELLKIKRVIQKIDPEAPHEVVLVLDAITGQNAIKQAQEFHRHIGLTGLILTKCDGSAKAGSAVAIVSELQLPVFYVGVGESVEDLDVFEARTYLEALLGIQESGSGISI